MRRLGAQAQFVAQSLEAQEAFHARDELQVVDRLGEEIVGASFQAAHTVGRLVERSHHDDRDMHGLGIGFQPLTDLEAIHARHHDVEKDEVDLGASAEIETGKTVGGCEHVEIFGQQAGFEQLYVGGNVVDDQNASCHDASLQASPR